MVVAENSPCEEKYRRSRGTWNESIERGTRWKSREETRRRSYIVKSMGYFYMKSLNPVYCETKYLDVSLCSPSRVHSCAVRRVA